MPLVAKRANDLPRLQNLDQEIRFFFSKVSHCYDATDNSAQDICGADELVRSRRLETACGYGRKTVGLLLENHTIKRWDIRPFFKKIVPLKYFLKKKIWKSNNQFSILNPFPFWWVRPSQGKTCAEQLAACILHMWGGTAIREPRKNGYKSGCRCFFSFSLITHRLSTFLRAEKQ